MRYLLFFFLSMNCLHAATPSFSLFLTTQEKQDHAAIADEKLLRSENEVCLDALVYFDENNWSVWLNGQHITPTTIPEHLEILRVDEDHFEVNWKKDDDVIPLILQVNVVQELY